MTESPRSEPMTFGAEPPSDSVVRFEVETVLRTTHGTFRIRGYRGLGDEAEHVALAKDCGDSALVRVHPECGRGAVFGSVECACAAQLQSALARVQMEGGVVLYLRGQDELGAPLAAERSGVSADRRHATSSPSTHAAVRDWDVVVAMLADLGVRELRLLADEPDDVLQLEARGVRVVEHLPRWYEAYFATR